ncbi:MAG: hypothetical protein HZA89_18120 [Verrucomicrobia bacterium]|nr:hypothetical protein [Verrucomicrobiota bacterium]
MRIQLPAVLRTPVRGAFTFIEVLMAAGVVGTVFISLYAGVSGGFSMVANAREDLRATQIMLEKLETLRLYNWNQINSNGFIPTNFTASFYPVGNTNGGVIYSGTLNITNFPAGTSYATNMRLVLLSVTWTSGQVTHRRYMQTSVARYGLQNYIY